MSDSEKEDKEKLHELEQLLEKFGQSDNSDPEKTKKLLLGIILGIAVLAPGQANALNLNALVEKFAKKITDNMVDQLGPLFEQIMGVAMSLWSSTTEQESAKNTSALGRVGDSINSVLVTLDKERVKRSTQPRPSHCESDERAKQVVLAEGAAVSMRENSCWGFGTKISDETFIAEAPTRFVQKLIDSGEENFGEYLQKVNIMNLPPEITPEEAERALEGVELMTSQVVASSGLMRVDANSSTATKREAQAKMRQASKAMVVETALKEQIHQRTRTGETSLKGGIAKEVASTYGSAEWRKKVTADYADPTPLLSEMCILTAQANYLSLEQLSALETQNKLLSIMSINGMEATS